VSAKKGDDLDRSIAQRTAKNKNFPALVADAEKRAQAFNAEERIAELEAEVARLRAALREVMDLDPDQSFADFVRESGRIAMLGLAKKPTKTTREERRKIIRNAGKKDRAVLDRLRDHDKKP
jgi:hypothetical protein